MLDLSFEREVVGDRDNFAIHARPQEACPSQLGEKILVLAFLAANHRSEDRKRRALGKLHRTRNDLFPRERRERTVALRAVADSNPREQDAEVIVDLGDGADRRSRVAAAGLLLDRDRWA